MEDPSMVVPLPSSVEEMLNKICNEQSQPPLEIRVRRELASLGEEASVIVLRKISSSTIRKSLSGYVHFMVTNYISLSPQKSSYSASTANSTNSPTNFSPHSPTPKHPMRSPSSSSERKRMPRLIDPLSALNELEFRKAFLILSYIGSARLEDRMSADYILELKDLQMWRFESKVWNDHGQHCCDNTDRRKYLDWDSGKTYLYHCHVNPDGSYIFKGPYLSTTRTHLQRQLGDDNVLTVKFAEKATDDTNKTTCSTYYNAEFNNIAEEGILVGLRRYRFFVFKDGGNEEKKKNPTSSPVKCYFVRMESFASWKKMDADVSSVKTIHDARCLFMHVHTVSSMAKYMARFSLILSKTITLPVDLSSVNIERIEDILCCDERGRVVCDEDGEPCIHTDGTGYISEDLALTCPKDFNKAKYKNDENLERFHDGLNLERGSEAQIRNPPLLMQVRLFNNGLAVKGTLLVNRKLPRGTIQFRPSMRKVKIDSKLSRTPTFNSLEIVKISAQPRKAYLSKNLIALLSYGGVPKEFFLDILTNALEDAHSVYSNKRAALRVALNYGAIDGDFNVVKMILAGIPLSEPSLQNRLSVMAENERKGLGRGRLPISESFYLMGTTDPTGILKSNEVCVIHESGQISGDVLVYRNPGIHFGDVHILNAVYVRALEEFVGNAKYAIFFSIQGQRSVANEIANGDFDGDMYWVSRNPQLLKYFKVSEPWRRMYSTPNTDHRKPSQFSAEEREHELFKLFLSTRFEKSYSMSVASDSWSAFMDRLLILGDADAKEKECLKEKILKLIDIYYDALDAPKSGKKVIVPTEIKAEQFPHYMDNKKNTYTSKSVLGIIYDTVKSFQTDNHSVEEICKLPCLDIEVTKDSLQSWNERYRSYRIDMSKALNSNNESITDAANDVIKKYKEMLYGDGAVEFEESKKPTEKIYDEALAIYNVTYDFARRKCDVAKCDFAWKVASSALLKLYAQKQAEKPILCLPSVLQEILN